MRLRNIPGADEVVSNSIYCIQEPVELKVFDNGGVQVKTAPKKMLYAEVIDIEDPDKEQI